MRIDWSRKEHMWRVLADDGSTQPLLLVDQDCIELPGPVRLVKQGAHGWAVVDMTLEELERVSCAEV